MHKAKDLFGYESLAFFGRVNASISHELKNIMAIISETAGLLSDLSDMASEGTPLDPEMLKSNAESIVEEIQRGFTTIRQMNRFSHSVDTPIAAVDLMAIVDLVCHLSDYLPFAGKTRLLPWDGEAPVARTCPFVLQAIIYEVLVHNFKKAGVGAVLDISVLPDSASGWVIIFYGFCADEFKVFPDEQTRAAAASIGVDIDWQRTKGQVKLHVPKAFRSGFVNDV
jgi:hypothetical protein